MPEPRRVIALVTDAIAPYHRGGKEQRYQELAPRLAQRAEVHVYTMNWWSGGSRQREGAVTYHAIAPLLPLYSGSRRSIRQAIVFAVCCLRLLTVRCDVIEADHMPYMQLVPLKLVALARRRRLVVTWHECWGPAYWQEYLGPAGRIGWWCEKLAMTLPDTIIAASPETGRRLAELVGSPKRIVTAPNGVDLAAIDAAVPAPDPADIIVVGRLLAHKRVDRLLDAVATLHRDGLTLTVDVIGSGPERSALAAQCDALGLQGLVRFRDDVGTQAELYGRLKAARVAVFPSEREGFGIAVLEALACRTPVVTTSAPDNLARHLVEDSQGGIVCAPTVDALAAAISDVLSTVDGVRTAEDGWLGQYDWESITDRVAGALA